MKLADFGVSLLTGEGSGPIALLARRPSSASLRGGMGASSMSIPPPPPSDPGVQPGPELPEEPSDDSFSAPLPRDLHLGSEEDDEADTNSIMKLDDSEFGTASLMISELKTEGPISRPEQLTSPAVPVVSINLAAHPSRVRSPSSRPPPMPQTMEMEAAKIPDTTSEPEPPEFKAPRPSQASMSAMLAAAPDDSVVVSGMLTQADALIGTPMYMAPELCNTGSHRAEPMSDIFSVGVIAFELLTGRMPFAVPPVISRANDEPIFITRLAQIRPDLDPRLIALVESCLALNPSSRLRAAELTRRLIEIGAPAPPV